MIAGCLTGWRQHGGDANGMPISRDFEARRTAVYDIVAAGRPMTVRQVFYQATVRGLIDKTEDGYNKIQWDLRQMRMNGDMPFEWIEDGTRSVHWLQTWTSPAEALHHAANTYHKNLWADADVFVEVWVEKDALTGVIAPVTEKYDVPLRPARGYASLSFLYDAASHIDNIDKPAFVYHLGDYDPSGVNAGETIDKTLRDLAPGADITFERLAVTPAQIRRWRLPSRPTKQSDTRAARFGSDVSVELDAIEPDQLRAIVREAIERHLSFDQYKRLKRAEERERKAIRKLVEDLA